jgi:hypothetical protein
VEIVGFVRGDIRDMIAWCPGKFNLKLALSGMFNVPWPPKSIPPLQAIAWETGV